MTNTEAVAGPATFDRLLAASAVPAFQLAHAMLGNRHDAEDAVQEAALKAWKSYRSWRHESDFRFWFLAIVANQCRSMRRTRWWRLRGATELPELAQRGHEDALVSRLDLQQLLDRLSGEQRALLHLSFGLDLPHAETARILGLRTGAVKTRLHRLVRALQRAAEEEETR